MFIDIIVILLDLALTCSITGFLIPTGNNYHYWAPLLILIGGYILSVLFMWCVLSLFAAFYPKDKEYKKPSKWANFWLDHAISYINYHALIKLKVTYLEPIPKNTRFLLVCNHMSKFDPMILAAKFGHYGLAFISKPSNFNIPVGAHFMKGCCYLSIDRYDKLKSLEVMNEATRLIAEDLTSIGVFPEGTRHNSIEEFGEFHEGVFAIATKAKCPIVITSLVGTDMIHVNFPKKFTKVRLKVLKVIYPEQFAGKTVKAISDEVREVMEKDIRGE